MWLMLSTGGHGQHFEQGSVEPQSCCLSFNFPLQDLVGPRTALRGLGRPLARRLCLPFCFVLSPGIPFLTGSFLALEHLHAVKPFSQFNGHFTQV